jgi:hypothetical protein
MGVASFLVSIKANFQSLIFLEYLIFGLFFSLASSNSTMARTKQTGNLSFIFSCTGKMQKSDIYQFISPFCYLSIIIPSKSEPLYYEVIKNLSEKVSPSPGFDAASLYSVIKALGPSFIHGTEKYNAKDGITYIYIKNSNRGMKKDEYRMILKSTLSFLMPKLPIPIIVNGIKLTKAVIYESRNENYLYFVKVSSTKAQEKKLMEMLRTVKTIDLVNPYPRAVCICHYNNVPYRAQIVAQITYAKINVELVVVGEFLTVTMDQLKVS